MVDQALEIKAVSIEDELKQSYLDYAMSVIVGRALPDVRDGLKPVHRRVLYAMGELSNDWNKPHKKSARIVGDVIGKYHPHGDTAVYDTIVRMAQPFSLRYLLVDGQGNFGSVDGDAPAAMRYTEIRLSRLAHALLDDLDKETVDFVPNYDETEKIPTVLPARVPNLLINGSAGIAVGMATNVPPHNLHEVIEACFALIDNPDLTVQQLLKYIPGPDFPTAGIINGKAGIVDAYATGRGRLLLRAKTEIETDNQTNKASIIVTELPYQVNKARLLEKIGELVREKRLEGITGLRDESDKDGMRMVIEIRRGDQPDVVLNNLYAHTQLQVVFGINMVALVNGQPRLLTLKEMLDAFLQHRREVVTRRSLFELRQARQRAHILEGLSVAIANIDAVIALIKTAKTPSDARDALLNTLWKIEGWGALLGQKTEPKTDPKTEMAAAMTPEMTAEIAPGAAVEGSMELRAMRELTRPPDLLPEYGLQAEGYQLSPKQVQAILDLKLQRLTGLETDKIHEEYAAIIKEIQALLKILSQPDELHRIIRLELSAIKEQFADARRTQIIETQEDLTLEDLITEQDVVVTVSNTGYIKSQSLDSYQSQHRGGRGKSATRVKEEDYVKNLLIANTHDTILCFSTLGKVYWLKVYQIPQGSRQSSGRPLVNLLPLQPQEQISTILPISDLQQKKYVFMATAQGTVKKVELNAFANPRTNGIIAIELSSDDHLVSAAITDGKQDVMLISSSGKAIRFKEDEIRVMGRTAQGVRGIRLQEKQRVIALIIVQPNGTLLTATEHGYGQRTRIDDYRLIGRGGQGVIAIQVNERNGDVIGAAQVTEQDEVLLITDHGTMVRIPVKEISIIGRNTQGVRLIQLAEDEKLVSLEPVREAPDTKDPTLTPKE